MKNNSDALLTALGFIALVASIIMFAPLFGVLFGAFAGWVIHITGFGLWVQDGLALLNVHVASSQLSTLGAALGFIGGFFKSVNKNTNNVK